MMLPWPAMSRGTEATVPRPPGLVSDIVAPAKSSGMQLVGARLLDQRLVGRVERGEVHRVGALDDRHDETAAAVLPLDVHREAERDAVGRDPVRRTVMHDQGVAHDRMLLGGLHERPRR